MWLLGGRLQRQAITGKGVIPSLYHPGLRETTVIEHAPKKNQ